jgi:hypothetical protein
MMKTLLSICLMLSLFLLSLPDIVPADSLVNLQGYRKNDNSTVFGEGYSYSDGPPPRHIDIDDLVKIRDIVYPTCGMPSISEKGGELTVLVRLQDGGNTTDWIVMLQTDDIVKQRHILTINTRSYITDEVHGDVYRLDCIVPQTAASDVYDIYVLSESLSKRYDMQHSSVRVVDSVKYGDENFTFIHITDNQTRDPGCYLPPLHDRRYLIRYAIDMIRLLNPAFVIHTGDWNFGMDYGNEHPGQEDEYEENYSVYWYDRGFAMFMIPGNHDGYASFDGCYVFPPCDDIHVNRDGLEYWQEYNGPQYYSFDYGRFHFIGINSYDGEPIRRDSYGELGIFSISVWNWGGELTENQEAWYIQDALDAASLGMENILFLHHDPRGAYTEDWWTWDCVLVWENPCWVWPRPADQVWNYRGSETGGDETPADNSGTRLRSFLLDPEHNFSHSFYGHEHVDVDEMDGHVRYLQTTTPCLGPYINETTGKVVLPRALVDYDGTEYGFRLVKVENGQITEVNFNGHGEQSIPIIDGNPDDNPPPNLECLFDKDDRNDGTDPAVKAVLTNRLPKDAEVTVEFYVPGMYIYSVSGGSIREIGTGTGKEKILYVESTVPAQSEHTIRVFPACEAETMILPVTAMNHRYPDSILMDGKTVSYR